MESKKEALVAKQPILDANNNIVAYELLFRSSSKNSAEISSNSAATATVLSNVLNSIGLEKLVGDKLAFINVDEEILLSGVLELLPPDRFVIEILEDVIVTDEIIAKVSKMHSKGFMFAIDDLDISSKQLANFEPLFEYMKLLKIDLMTAGGIEEVKNKISFFDRYDLKLLIEKVETKEEFLECKKLGFDYYQGWYFQKPVIIEGKKLNPTKTAALSVLKIVQDGYDLPKIVAQIESSPELVISILKYINSSSFATKTTISSIKQAINLLGKDRLIQWLVLHMYSSSQSEFLSPLMELAKNRAETIKDLSYKLHKDSTLGEKGYLVGLLSLFDAIMQTPFSEAKDEIALDVDIVDAIEGKTSSLGELLRLATYMERAKWSDISKLNYSQKDLASAIL